MFPLTLTAPVWIAAVPCPNADTLMSTASAATIRKMDMQIPAKVD
jgi:hypothetical protein